MIYIEAVTPILLLVVGWMMGWLTPLISERLRRPHRRKELTRAIKDEMLGLQFMMAFVAFSVRSRYAEVSDAFLDEILPIVESYRDMDRDEKTIESMKSLRALPETERREAFRVSRKPNVGMNLKQYGMPLLASEMAEMTICPLEFQRAILKIRHQLDLFNQIAPYTNSMSEKTFNNPTPQDREAILANQEQAYQDAGRRAEIIMRAIGSLSTI